MTSDTEEHRNAGCMRVAAYETVKRSGGARPPDRFGVSQKCKRQTCPDVSEPGGAPGETARRRDRERRDVHVAPAVDCDARRERHVDARLVPVGDHLCEHPGPPGAGGFACGASSWLTYSEPSSPDAPRP